MTLQHITVRAAVMAPLAWTYSGNDAGSAARQHKSRGGENIGVR